MTPMNLFRHKNGLFYIRYSRMEAPPDGAKVSLRSIVGYPVADEQKAKAIFNTLSQEWHKKKIAELDKINRISITDFIQDFTTGERGDLSAATLRMDDLSLRMLSDVIGATRAIRAIDANDLIKFKAVCLARNLSPNTIKSYLRHIKSALNHAIDKGYRTTLPKFPKVKAPKPIPKVMPPEAITAILSWAKQNDMETWRYAAFAVWTGCRLSEIANLRWPDVTLYSPSPLAGEGRGEGGIHGHAVVTGKGDKQRTIYLTAAAIEAIFSPSSSTVGAAPLIPSPSTAGIAPLIPSPLTGEGQGGGVIKRIGKIFKPWTPTTISKKFKAAARSAGHPEAHFHALRHTAATMMITAGMRFETVREILGHADIRTTEIYAKVLNTVVMADMEKFANITLGKL